MGLAFPPWWLPFEENGLTYEGQVPGSPGVTAVAKAVTGPGSFRGRKAAPGRLQDPSAMPRTGSHLFFSLPSRVFYASFGFLGLPMALLPSSPNSRPSLPFPEIVSG